MTKVKVLHGPDIPPRVMVKQIEEVRKTAANLIVPDGADEMKKAIVVQVPEQLQSLISEGDKVYMMEAREKGLVKHQGQDHNIIPLGQIVAIIEPEDE